jgi:hypothetical protein
MRWRADVRCALVFLAYCAATTDSVALFRKLDELKAAETSYNEQVGMLSL